MLIALSVSSNDKTDEDQIFEIKEFVKINIKIISKDNFFNQFIMT